MENKTFSNYVILEKIFLIFKVKYVWKKTNVSEKTHHSDLHVELCKFGEHGKESFHIDFAIIKKKIKDEGTIYFGA